MEEREIWKEGGNLHVKREKERKGQKNSDFTEKSNNWTQVKNLNRDERVNLVEHP